MPERVWPEGERYDYIEKIDSWLLNERPDLDAVVAKLAEVRQLKKQVDLAEAHLVGYGMVDLLHMDYELEETPRVLLDPRDLIDE